MSGLTSVARKLRREATSAERRLWRILKLRQVEGFKFRRQVVLQNYIADFACLEARLIVEVDGATRSTDEELRRNAVRNQDVYDNLEGVAETIWLKLRERPRTESVS